MKRILSAILSTLISTTLFCVLSAQSFAAPAPTFTLKDINGKSHSLSDYKGKIVVLEWFNPGCPFVKKHYMSGNMQSLQEKYTKLGVVWFTVNSSAFGRQGYLTQDEAKKKFEDLHIKATAALVDTDGTVGKSYNARTTPHLFVVDKNGELAYQGAIDSDDSVKEEAIKESTNYVAQTIDELQAGKPVSVPLTEPYGCSVKY
jgi:peroxiredoxin